MADKPYVFILPGFMGSYLDGPKNSRGNTPRYWYSVGGLAVRGVSYLTLAADGYSSQNPKWGQLMPAGLDVDTYSPLHQRLQNDFTVQPVPYDWRWDVRLAAAGAWQTMKNTAGTNPFYVVSHSMGNFVARFVYRLAVAEGKGAQFLRLVALAAPYNGAWSAVGLFTRCDKFYTQLLLLTNLDNLHPVGQAVNLGGYAIKKIKGVKGYTTIDKAICSWPSSYGLLPFPEEHPQAERLYQAGNYQGFNTFVQQQWLDNARLMQKELLDKTKDVPKAKLVSVVGISRQTMSTIKTNLALDDTRGYQTLDGDGRVEAQNAHLYNPSEGFAVSQEDHTKLVSAAYVLDNIGTFLLNGIPTEAPAPQPPPIVVPANAPLLPTPLNPATENSDWRSMLGTYPQITRPAERPSYCP
jgi:hypothetical protein